MIEENAEFAPGKALVESLDRTGLPQTVKGKVQKLILRLVAGGPGYNYYQKARERLDVVEGRSRISNIVADEIGRQALLDPEFMERAKARFLGDMAAKQENVEAVAAEAQAKVDAMPEAEQQSASDALEPSQDWLNAFTREAELASSDELRERLASILAGEARKPGTFSRSTIRLVAEFEKDILESFQSILPRRIGDAIFRDESWTQGEFFQKGVTLEDVGLISGSGGFTSRFIVCDENGNGFLLGDVWAMVISADAGTKKQVPVWMLTRAGREIASLLPASDERETLRLVANKLGKDGLKQIYLGPMVPRDEGIFVVRDEIVWDKNADAAAA